MQLGQSGGDLGCFYCGSFIRSLAAARTIKLCDPQSYLYSCEVSTVRLCKEFLPLLILAAVTVRAVLRHLPIAAVQVFAFRAASQE
jgi:hypothetical protein